MKGRGGSWNWANCFQKARICRAEPLKRSCNVVYIIKIPSKDKKTGVVPGRRGRGQTVSQKLNDLEGI
jgi:hypothetical protein